MAPKCRNHVYLPQRKLFCSCLILSPIKMITANEQSAQTRQFVTETLKNMIKMVFQVTLTQPRIIFCDVNSENQTSIFRTLWRFDSSGWCALAFLFCLSLVTKQCLELLLRWQSNEGHRNDRHYNSKSHCPNHSLMRTANLIQKEMFWARYITKISLLNKEGIIVKNSHESVSWWMIRGYLRLYLKIWRNKPLATNDFFET